MTLWDFKTVHLTFFELCKPNHLEVATEVASFRKDGQLRNVLWVKEKGERKTLAFVVFPSGVVLVAKEVEL